MNLDRLRAVHTAGITNGTVAACAVHGMLAFDSGSAAHTATVHSTIVSGSGQFPPVMAHGFAKVAIGQATGGADAHIRAPFLVRLAGVSFFFVANTACKPVGRAVADIFITALVIHAAFCNNNVFGIAPIALFKLTAIGVMGTCRRYITTGFAAIGMGGFIHIGTTPVCMV